MGSSTTNALRSTRDKLHEQCDAISDMTKRLYDLNWEIFKIGEEVGCAANRLEVDRVTYSGPVTVVVWKDGTTTKTRCQYGDEYSREVGFLMCVAKKALPNWHEAMSEHVWGQE